MSRALMGCAPGKEPVMRHDPAGAALIIMLRSLKMPGMAQAVQDHDLVPEGALGLHSDHIRHGQVQVREILCDVGCDGGRDMRIECRLGSCLYLDG